MNHLFGLKWNKNPKYLAPIGPMTPAQARTAWDTPDEVFSVSAGPDLEPGRVPTYTLHVGVNETVVVDRYHPSGALASSYFYDAESTIRDGSRLFLTQVSTWTEDRTHASFEYRPDGWGRTMVKEGDDDVVYEFSGVDVSGHWIEPGLSWDDWDRIGLHEPSYLALDPADGREVARN
jgi:hypothetical protein